MKPQDGKAPSWGLVHAETGKSLSLVEAGIDEVDILLVHAVLRQPQALAEALEVDHLPGPEELDDVVDVRVVTQAQDVVIGDTGLLLCCDLVRTTFLLSELGRLSGCLILCYNNPEFGSLSILNGDL